MRGAGADIGCAVGGDEKGGKNVSRRIIKSDEREEPLGKIGDWRGAGQVGRKRCWHPFLDLDCRSLKVLAGASRLSVR